MAMLKAAIQIGPLARREVFSVYPERRGGTVPEVIIQNPLCTARVNLATGQAVGVFGSDADYLKLSAGPTKTYMLSQDAIHTLRFTVGAY